MEELIDFQPEMISYAWRFQENFCFVFFKLLKYFYISKKILLGYECLFCVCRVQAFFGLFFFRL